MKKSAGQLYNELYVCQPTYSYPNKSGNDIERQNFEADDMTFFTGKK